jgi:DNA-binding XRE family transcriptional regulator
VDRYPAAPSHTPIHTFTHTILVSTSVAACHDRGEAKESGCSTKRRPSLRRSPAAQREARGLTQEGLAERARLSARAISDLERGLKETPHATTVHLLVLALERIEFII